MPAARKTSTKPRDAAQTAQILKPPSASGTEEPCHARNHGEREPKDLVGRGLEGGGPIGWAYSVAPVTFSSLSVAVIRACVCNSHANKAREVRELAPASHDLPGNEADLGGRAHSDSPAPPKTQYSCS